MKKNTYYLIMSMALLSMAFFSCAPKYSASFQKSRNFYTPEKTVVSTQPEQASPPATSADVTKQALAVTPVIASVPAIHPVTHSEKVQASPALTASTKKSLVAQLSEVPSIKKLVEKHRANVEDIKSTETDQKTMAREIKKEQRRAQKEVKKELYKEIKSVKKAQKKNMNQKVFVGLVIFAAGVIVAILASGPIGAVGIIVGVALIAWGIIEQGGV